MKTEGAQSIKYCHSPPLYYHRGFAAREKNVLLIEIS